MRHNLIDDPIITKTARCSCGQWGIRNASPELMDASFREHVATERWLSYTPIWIQLGIVAFLIACICVLIAVIGR